MDLSVPSATLAALLLASARATGFIVMAPPFNSGSIPKPAKAALALALSLVAFPHIVGTVPEVTAGFLVVTAITEAVIGAALGFIVQVFFTAVQLAGDLIDVTGGFSLQPAYDPLSLSSHGVIGRLHYLLAITLLFTSGAHLLLVRGFVTSYQGLPLGGSLPAEQLGPMMLTAFSMMFLAALQIAGPMVAVLMLADVALALLSKAAPALNIFSLGFPVKIMITLTMLGLTFPLLPPALDGLMDTALEAITSLRSG
ncbi:flagellar biosynthetic protein FliR [Modestobacter muralis]|uniref:Flagellar biosynthetic protein FliR n=1 Tax=Modestobacter muralis TaxID=1608614 RepID=A0A6P0EYI5_9ACTN|nr:flagellar biosynthetic protein FliR [Modestobacter muralis]NEK94894.1 flagellar biosynthetic protein FliR [Modestobacter muralis]NEN51782.1 flagellar biosynthetic protein FliR [Modestobacter muralis]